MDIALIEKRLKFEHSTVSITKIRTLRRIQALANAVEQRFAVRYVEQIKQKHCQYLLDWLDSNYADATKLDYQRSLAIMIRALQRDHWLRPLNLEKPKGKGGRPSKSSIVRSRSRLYL